MTDGVVGIEWLENKRSEIQDLVTYLEGTGGFDVDICKSGRTAVQRIQRDPSKRILVVDLNMGDGQDSIGITRTARAARPDLRCVALSHYLDDAEYATRLVKTRATGENLFVRYWQKQDLVSEPDYKRFGAELKILSQQEYMTGSVVEWEHDYGKVALRGIDGSLYERVFERDFLADAGVRQAGDIVHALFSRSTEQRGASLCMDVWAEERDRTRDPHDAKRLIRRHLDMRAVRRRLG